MPWIQPIMADESIFSPDDAFELLKIRAVDLINIKLMKAGGIYHAETISRMAEACGVHCMVGSMIETRIGISAAAHFAAAKRNITRYDFDAPLMMGRDAVQGASCMRVGRSGCLISPVSELSASFGNNKSS